MKVFIGWSGETSAKIAPILGNWLRRTFDDRIQVVSFSMEDSLEEAIGVADCALLCVTADNVNSQWLAYEAGALRGRVQLLVPLLFDVGASRFNSPLSMFQPVFFDFDDMLELMRKFNDLLGADALPPDELEESFPERYPTLEGLVQETLSENEPQTRENWERNELNEISAQLAELTKRVERLKTKISDAKAPRKYSYRKTSRYM